MNRCFLFVFLLLPALSIAADQQEDKQLLKALQEENQQLRAELAQLRLELSQLKRQLQDKAEADPGPATPADDDPDEAGKPSKQERVRTFRSGDEIYRALPQELAPKKDGWDVVRKKKVADWLAEHVDGQKFSDRRTIQSVAMRFNGLTDQWEMTITLVHQPMQFMGWSMEERLGRIVIKGDESFAEQAKRKYVEGRRVTVMGTIEKVGWDLISAQRHDENWHPSYCSIVLSDVSLK